MIWWWEDDDDDGCESLTSSFFIQYFIFSANNELPKTSGFGDPESKAAQREGSHTRDNASDKGVFIVVQTPASAHFVDPLFWEYNMYIFLRWKTQSEGVFFLGRGYPWHSCSCATGRVHGASIGSVFSLLYPDTLYAYNLLRCICSSLDYCASKILRVSTVLSWVGFTYRVVCFFTSMAIVMDASAIPGIFSWY